MDILATSFLTSAVYLLSLCLYIGRMLFMVASRTERVAATTVGVVETEIRNQAIPDATEFAANGTWISHLRQATLDE